jgi:hypothetical protein
MRYKPLTDQTTNYNNNDTIEHSFLLLFYYSLPILLIVIMATQPEAQLGVGVGEYNAADGYDDDCVGKVFVGGLSWQTTIEGLRYYFEKFGELTDVALMSDKRSGQPRGFGFITFRDPAGTILRFIQLGYAVPY